jgi:hypothetical protein
LIQNAAFDHVNLLWLFPIVSAQSHDLRQSRRLENREPLKADSTGSYLKVASPGHQKLRNVDCGMRIEKES